MRFAQPALSSWALQLVGAELRKQIGILARTGHNYVEMMEISSVFYPLLPGAAAMEVTPSCPEFVIVWDNINTCMRADPSGEDNPRSQSSTSEIDEGLPDLLAEDGADGKMRSII
ncbi:hypothetical protein B0H14DRAFT_3169401 [Mycena olivaceomarginata]|nr:hypothetical protein B0H14DRAFT_3169401 [Mycena olivaceomarginata]